MPKTRRKEKPKPRWRTIRCIVEYRTSDDSLSEPDLARHIQHLLDSRLAVGGHLRESRIWAKSFQMSIGRMEKVRPKKLQAAINAADALTARLRKL